MYYAATQQMTAARHIARSARQQIKNKTGMQVTVVLYPTETTLKTPENMLRVIAVALDMAPGCFRMKTRIRSIAELRFIAAVLIRTHFPKVTLHQIAAFFGGQDHTSVINGLTRAYDLIYTGDQRFLNKYNKAAQSVNIWLRTEE
jgi:chromosomal replication initiation ATPase DnaA